MSVLSLAHSARWDRLIVKGPTSYSPALPVWHFNWEPIVSLANSLWYLFTKVR